MSSKKDNAINIKIDKVITRGGHNTPPKKKDDYYEGDDNTMIPINESDVKGLDYLTE